MRWYKNKKFRSCKWNKLFYLLFLSLIRTLRLRLEDTLARKTKLK